VITREIRMELKIGWSIRAKGFEERIRRSKERLIKQ